MLPDAEHTPEEYLHLGETQEPSQANAETFNPQDQTTASEHALTYSKKVGKISGKSPGKPCTYCDFNQKFGQCLAKEAKCKICEKTEQYAKMCRSKYRKTKQNNDRSNNQSFRLTGNKKKSTNIHLMADDGGISETTQRENIPWTDSICVQSKNTTTYSANGYSKIRNAHKTRSHQAFTMVQMFPMKRIGKTTGNNPKGMKYKLDTGAGVNIMSLSIYQYISPSEFDAQGKPFDGHGQYRTTLKDYNGNPIQ